MSNKKIQKFDLFKLHIPEEDKDPKWSWIRASGKDLAPYVYSLIRELTNKHGTNNTAKQIKKLVPRLSLESILNYFWSKYERFPLIFLEALSKQFRNSEQIKQKIQDKIETLSISRYDSKPIKAVKELNLTLCKIAGAHAADGSLWGEYNYELIDGDQSAVTSFSEWLNEVFGYNAKSRMRRRGKAYSIYFKSRIFGRYLNKFLGFPIGKKTDIVEEPKIIKESNPNFRRAFALGVMTFDGSVDTRGKCSIQMKSKRLICSLYDILQHENIFVSFNRKEDKEGRYKLQSSYADQKLLNYFDKNSEKYQRIYEFVNGFGNKVKNIKDAKIAFDLAYPKTTLSMITFSKLLDLLPKEKKFSYQDLLKILRKDNIKISSTTLKYYIKILASNKIVYLFEKQGQFKIFKFNRNIMEWRVPKR